MRKKAVVAVHKFFKIVPEAVLDQKDAAQHCLHMPAPSHSNAFAKDQIRKVLCDPDPSVMGASLHVLCEAKPAVHQCRIVSSTISVI